MIAYGMLYAAAVGLPILLAATVGSTVLRRHGRPERGIWLVALGLALTLPAIALLSPFGGTSATPLPLPTGVIGLPDVVAVPGAGSGLGLNQVLGVLWLVVSGVLALRWAVAALRLERASRSWRPEIVDGISSWLTKDLGPAVSGVLKPRILVPSWLESLPQRQRSLILLHEQEHVRARDPLLMAVSRVARILAPWNPAVWLLSARLLDAVELDCDRRVLGLRPDVETYGSTLLTVSARDSGRLVVAAAFAEPKGPLHKRILAMTTPPGTVSVVGLLTSMVLGVVLLIGAFEIPVPSLSVQIGVDPAESGTEAEAATPREVAAAPEDPPTPPDASILDAGPPAATTVEVPTSPAPPIVPTQPKLSPTEASIGESSRASGPTEPPDPDLGVEPTFTPFTVAPSILNRQEVVRAMEREYPPLLRDAGIGGQVAVYFFIDENGEVQNFRVETSSGHPALDDAALAVAGVYRFSPALNRDTPVPVWVQFSITFQVRSP